MAWKEVPRETSAERPDQWARLVLFEGVDSERFEDARWLREEIFVKEQGVLIEDEQDGLDSEARHGVFYRGDEPVGVVRMRDLDDDWVKVERVGVLKAHRNEGLGTQLMDLVEATARNNGKRITLNSQIEVVDWYARRGYSPEGVEFEEAGIPHQKMIKQP